jgi:hypothetical protein
MAEQPPPRSWWHRLRISLRAFVVLVVAIGGALGWWVNSARVQRVAIAAIKRAGGRCEYDMAWNFPRAIPGRKPLWLRRLAQQMGLD